LEYIKKYEKYKDKKIESYLSGSTLNMESIKEKAILKYFEQSFSQDLKSKDDIAESLTSILPSGTSTTFLNSVARRIKLINQGSIPMPTKINLKPKGTKGKIKQPHSEVQPKVTSNYEDILK